MSIISSSDLISRHAARYPNAQPGVIESISAAAGKVSKVDAGAVKGFAAVAGNLQWVKATDHFRQGGEVILAGDFVQVQEDDAKRLLLAGQVELATDEDVRAASAGIQAGKAKA